MGPLAGSRIQGLSHSLMTLRMLLSDLLGTGLSIIQAPLGCPSCPPLTAAVSNAAGFGMLALSGQDLEAARNAIPETRTLSDRFVFVALRRAVRWADS